MRLEDALQDRVLAHDIYLLGYEGKVMPRWLRRTLYGRILHHAWLAGYLGIYVDYRGRSSVVSRDDFRARKKVPGDAWPFIKAMVGVLLAK